MPRVTHPIHTPPPLPPLRCALDPEVRPTNTAWSELLLFAHVYLGIGLGDAIAHREPLSPCPAAARLPFPAAWRFLVGLLALGVGRTALSEALKAALGGSARLKPKDARGRQGDTMTNVCRQCVVTLMTAVGVAATPPPCLWFG